MKYSNSLKYVNSFEMAESLCDLSPKRMRELCLEMGRVNVGSKYIVVSADSAGHASAVMLESVIKCAGYTVGRITSDSCFDARTSVFVNGELASIEDFNKCVAEIKSIIIKKTEEKYYRQEVIFALSLLICKLVGCEFVILEGLSGEGYSLDAICAPFDLVVVPTLYSESRDDVIKTACDAIKRGVREAVSGNQKNSVYNLISNACMVSGTRLNVTAKPTLNVTAKNARRVEFSYAERDGYVLKSPSGILRDCAMLVIESALAIRRAGVRMPWGSIAEGLERSCGSWCFDMLCASPAVIVDSACYAEEISNVIDTFESTVEPMNDVVVCIGTDGTRLDEQLAAFEERRIDRLILCGTAAYEQNTQPNAVICRRVQDAAKEVYGAFRGNKTVLCLGSVSFAREIKAEFIKLMGL